MKNKIFKSGFCEKLKLLLIPIGLLIGSLTTQVWAYSPVYLNGDFTGGNWGTNGNGSETYQVNYELDGSNSGHYFLPIYTSSGDKYWRFCENNGSAYLNCPATDNEVMNVGTAPYQIEGGHKYNFKSTVDAGIIAVHIHQNYDGKGKSANGSNDRPRVWLERPTIYIWHNWSGNTSNWGDNGGAGQKAMTDNNDGTYYYDGVYSASGTNVGIQGSAAIKKYFADNAMTKVGSPVSGNKCRFTWDSNGNSDPYVGYDAETSHRGSLTITKILTITYHGNGNEGGSAPSNEEVLYNTATATYTNTGNMTKTNYAFIGWNTQADGRGTHYDAGANITLTTNKDLYAEWVPCWVLRGGNSGSADGSDAMGDWTPQEMTIIGTNAFMIELDLAASTTYYFKICDRHNGKKADYSTYTHYGNNGTMSGTTLDWNFESNKGNCTLSTGASGGGTWRFAWNASSKYLCVYAPADASKSSFTQGKYIYFDARSNSTWKSSEFKAKFWFKNLATGADDGDIQCFHANALEDWVYYALVPANKTWGSVQMNSRNASTDAFNYDANTIYARGRSNANQNCMVVPSSGGSGVTLSWGTYCPPMSSATLSDNSTNKISWQDAGNDGSTSGKAILVSTSKTIEVSGAATKALDDTNMTINYDFKVGGSSAQAGSSNTYSKGSLSNNTPYTITMDAYNTYNGATGTKLTAGQTLYYKALDTYSVTNTLTNISSNGRSGSDAAAYNIAYTATLSVGTGYNLPATITVKRGETTLTASTHYTYNSSTGALSINAAQVTGNLTIIAAGVAKTYTEADNLDKNGGDAHGKYTATYEATSIVINTPPTYTGYTIDGYYGEAGLTTYIADAEGNLQASKNVGGYAVTDEDAQWKRDANITLYTKWTPNPYTLTLDDQFGSTAFKVAANSGDATIDVTFDSNTNLTSGITPPQREGYIFGGYYTETGGSGTQIIDENGDVKASASDASYTYTDASRNWKYVGNLTVYAKWTDDNVYVFIGDDRPEQYGGGFYDYGFWRSDDNWAKGKAPSDIDNHEVILIKQPSVENVSGQTYTACAKNVKIITNGSYTCVDGTEIPIAEYPKLDIDDNGAIVVKEYVKTYDLVGKTFGPTTSMNLHINAGTGRWGTAGSGGVLIMGDKITDNKAWVEFYTKAHKASHYDDEKGETVNDYVNQYFGIPFDSTSVYDYEGVYLYAYKAETNSYEAAGNKPVNPFMAYLMLRTETEGTTLHMTGRLALPGANPEDPERLKVLNLHSKEDATASNMFANSWNGPIDIKAMDVEGVNTDFVGVEPTFYFYNAGSKYDQEQAGSKMGDGAGQWSSFPVAAVKADPSSYPQSVIPPQQAFLLVAQSNASSATHTLTLDYYKHVYKPAYDLVNAGEKIEIAPTRAPRHATMEYPLEIIQLHVQGADREYSDRVIMYQRNDFSDGIDQGWEGRKIMGSSFAPQMFSISEDGKMSINAVKDVEGTVIGFRKGSEDAQYTISFEYRGEDVWYLNDLKEEKSTLISDEDTYMFTSNDSDIETRFVISATPIHKTPTSVDNLNDGVKARKQMIDGTLYIIRDGRIYSTTGAMVK